MNCSETLKNKLQVPVLEDEVKTRKMSYKMASSEDKKKELIQLNKAKKQLKKAQELAKLKNPKELGKFLEFPDCDKRDNYMRNYKIDITEEEKISLQNYFGRDYVSINEKLRYSKIKQEINVRSDIMNIENAISKNTVKDSLKVYRGSSFEKSTIDKMQIGSVFSDKAFVSTTLEKNTAKNYTTSYVKEKKSVLMRIKVKKGVNGIMRTGVDGGMFESELLLQAGSRFKVINKVQEKDYLLVDLEHVGI